MTVKVNEKEISIKKLRKNGIPVIPGNEYFKDWPKPKGKVTLAETRKILAKFNGSLSDELIKMRNQERF